MFVFKKKSSAKSPPDPDQTRARLNQALKRTREGLFSQLTSFFTSQEPLDPVLLDDLEDHLISADLGLTATAEIMDDVREKVRKKNIVTPAQLLDELRSIMIGILKPVHHPLEVPAGKRPFLIMMTGVNGAGKTTTIGKLARRFIQQGASVMLAAADTYRAAAIEQLQTWGERNKITVISQASGADAAAVIFDALESARSRDIDILIADTAGRLHTRNNLMQELEKVARVVKKFDPELNTEMMLVLDAGTGQNALVQAREFHKAIGITGIVLTKLDGTAKGGIVFALARELGIPIRFIGVGEQLDDLRPFEPECFVTALLAQQS